MGVLAVVAGRALHLSGGVDDTLTPGSHHP
jgi:hypothetical protein